MKTHQIKTAIRLAFENIKVMRSAYTDEGARIGSMIQPKLDKGPGIINRPDWNAHLSHRTAQLLNAPKFDHNEHYGRRNAYDCMVAV